ncbi:caspase-8-like [Stegastes partitus]|uniref:Caspase-8-like n=1 Tax=Stegastes partitus TaxID=144197 RepID=A0A9Y4NUH0_9TELE|nr:PREDICTED: caspase-8-like [Stegastes partitus]
MSAKDIVRRNKTDIHTTLCGDYRLILNKVHEKNLITTREYNNLKSINKEDVEGHVVELVDKIMNKGEKTCQDFLDLLETDDVVKSTYPLLSNMRLHYARRLPEPVQVSSVRTEMPLVQDSKRPKMLAQLQEFSIEEWSDSGFTEPQQGLKHGDAFICCVLSHGDKGVVVGTDEEPYSIKDITKTFKATEQSALTGKPKVFLIQACQGTGKQRGVPHNGLEDDSGGRYIPEAADVLVAIATVEDYVSMRHIIDGTWFIQSLCQQLRERCPRGEDLITILHHVNNEVGQKEVPKEPGAVKQMPEVRFTLRKKLVLSPHSS